MEEKKSQIITPNDPAFTTWLKDTAPDAFEKYRDETGTKLDLDVAKDLAKEMDSTAVQFTKRSTKNFEFEYGVQELSDIYSKVVFHFSRITRTVRGELAEFLGRKIQAMLPSTNMDGEFSDNPEFRDHWDVIIYTSNFEAPFIRDRLLVFIDRFNETYIP